MLKRIANAACLPELNTESKNKAIHSIELIIAEKISTQLVSKYNHASLTKTQWPHKIRPIWDPSEH